MRQASRLKYRQAQAKEMLDGAWEVSTEQCKCGRNHCGIKSISRLGEKEYCPATIWVFLYLFGDRKPCLSLVDWIAKSGVRDVFECSKEASR